MVGGVEILVQHICEDQALRRGGQLLLRYVVTPGRRSLMHGIMSLMPTTRSLKLTMATRSLRPTTRSLRHGHDTGGGGARGARPAGAGAGFSSLHPM